MSSNNAGVALITIGALALLVGVLEGALALILIGLTATISGAALMTQNKKSEK